MSSPEMGAPSLGALLDLVTQYRMEMIDLVVVEAALSRALVANFATALDAFGQLVFERAQEKGWYREEETFGDQIALLHSEVSEALEAFRTHGVEDFYTMDPSHGTAKPEGVRSELVDVLIRLCGIATARNLSLGGKLEEKLRHNAARPYRHGGKQL